MFQNKMSINLKVRTIRDYFKYSAFDIVASSMQQLTMKGFMKKTVLCTRMCPLRPSGG